MENSKSVLEMSSQEAEAFFLENESYHNIPLPSYFSFSDLLDKLSKLIDENRGNTSNYFKIEKAKEEYDVNYIIYGNKDGKLSYRPLQLIHPLIYVSLVKDITKEENWGKLRKRFRDSFQKNPKIKCCSIPFQSNNEKPNQAEQISDWWTDVEQESIDLSLEYSYIYDTDIADCYGSIYTHSIAWAVETKEIAKESRRDKTLLGNSIDEHIQAMQNGQTNGIPQGSVLMDFIAEIVLGYIDELLTKQLEEKDITDYRILRYRDDYKIFVNNSNDGLNILKTLSQILVPFGLKLNTSKTKENKDIISNVIKKDKLEWLKLVGSQENIKTIQKQLLLIRQHSIEYPNSGSVIRALNEFNKNLKNEKSSQVISICVDIIFKNTDAIPVCSSIISKVLQNFDDQDKKVIIKKIYKKIISKANSDIANIWLQRIVKSKSSEYNFNEILCRIVQQREKSKLCEIIKLVFCAIFGIECNIKLWNSEWINGNNKFKKLIDKSNIVDREKWKQLDEVIKDEEVNIFYRNYSH